MTQPTLDERPEVALEISVRMFSDPRGQERLQAIAQRLHRMAAAELSGASGRAEVTTRMTVTVAPPAAPRPVIRADGADQAGQRPARHGLVLRTGPREALLDGANLGLTKIQYDLLLFLANHAGHVLTRRQLLARVCDKPVGGCPRTIDVHIKRLRAKLGDDGPTITTIRGVGYRLDDRDRITVTEKSDLQL